MIKVHIVKKVLLSFLIVLLKSIEGHAITLGMKPSILRSLINLNY